MGVAPRSCFTQLNISSCDIERAADVPTVSILDCCSIFGPLRIMFTRDNRDVGTEFCWHSGLNDPSNGKICQTFLCGPIKLLWLIALRHCHDHLLS